jgi:hypothetical protein
MTEAGALNAGFFNSYECLDNGEYRKCFPDSGGRGAPGTPRRKPSRRSVLHSNSRPNLAPP